MLFPFPLVKDTMHRIYVSKTHSIESSACHGLIESSVCHGLIESSPVCHELIESSSIRRGLIESSLTIDIFAWFCLIGVTKGEQAFLRATPFPEYDIEHTESEEGGSTSDGSSKKKGGSTSDESSKKKGGSTSDGSSKKKGGSTSEGSSKKTGKGKTKKQVRLSIKPKKPSKKSLLQKQVTQLEEELAGVSKDLGEREVQLKEVRGKHGRELESKEACVEHLGRVLRRKTEELAEVQDRLQWVRDLTELMQQRAYDLKRSIDRNRQVKKSIFLQQYAELEDKLSRLEEVRLKRNSQLAHLKRVDDNLQVKTNVDRGEKREDNKMHVRNMLQKREEFENLMDNIGSNSMDVFQLSLPVYARQQLDDNIYLRQKCESISEDLLRLQEHSRHLKEVRNNLDLEMETQNSTEAKLIELDSSLGARKTVFSLKSTICSSA
ncbi:hypothetical protein CEXT_409031 [Caerostris extrusa]|uniref:Uncharacterized protein n=1 Tax=Caerostris extrusa TaxID=172846 RepID=A0AAV4WAE4_CAEEX|nr:hypothetical protein CEXT_409031 [Caerostris extrusa]